MHQRTFSFAYISKSDVNNENMWAELFGLKFLVWYSLWLKLKFCNIYTVRNATGFMQVVINWHQTCWLHAVASSHKNQFADFRLATSLLQASSFWIKSPEAFYTLLYPSNCKIHHNVSSKCAIRLDKSSS